MNDAELFDYMTQRTTALREATVAHTYRATGAEDRADQLLWDAIKYFGSALYNKAKLARDKYGFAPFGWVYPDWEAELQQDIAEHLQKGDPRDVGIYALFAYFHGWPTAPALSAPTASTSTLGEPDAAFRQEVAKDLGYLMDICGAVSDSDMMEEISASADRLGLKMIYPTETATRPAPAATLEAGQGPPPSATDIELAELEQLQQEAIVAFTEWDNDSGSVQKLEASDAADIALGRAAADVLPGLLARLRDSETELEGLDQLSQKQAKILSATAIALRGPEPPLTKWSHHDVAELAAAAMARLRAAEAAHPAPTLAARGAAETGGWVLVSERLPEPGIDVLVCQHRDDCAINIAQYLPDEIDEGEDAWEYGYGEWLTPSFWMPLPAQPVAAQEALCERLPAAPTEATSHREEGTGHA